MRSFARNCPPRQAVTIMSLAAPAAMVVPPRKERLLGMTVKLRRDTTTSPLVVAGVVLLFFRCVDSNPQPRALNIRNQGQGVRCVERLSEIFELPIAGRYVGRRWYWRVAYCWRRKMWS